MGTAAAPAHPARLRRSTNSCRGPPGDSPKIARGRARDCPLHRVPTPRHHSPCPHQPQRSFKRVTARVQLPGRPLHYPAPVVITNAGTPIRKRIESGKSAILHVRLNNGFHREARKKLRQVRRGALAAVSPAGDSACPRPASVHCCRSPSARCDRLQSRALSSLV